MMQNMQETTKHQVVQVALKVPFAPHLDYSLPDDLNPPLIGGRVLVPLGKNKQLVGVVVGLVAKSEFKKLKPISEILDTEPLLNAETLQLLQLAAKYYQVSFGEMIFTAIPAWFRKIDNRPIPIHYWWQTTASLDQAKTALNSAPKQLQVFEYLHLHGPLQSRTMSHISPTAAQI